MSKVRVLVVEDNKTWQKRILRWLKRYDCEVDVAGGYEEAKNNLNLYAYDMITLDMALSQEEEVESVSISSGWELLVGDLTRDFPGTAIFVISASFGDEPRRAFELNRKYGVRDFMTKGVDFDPATLQKWVEDVRKFKEIGGRPDTTPQELLDLYEQQLDIQQKKKAHAELQKAKHGLNVPFSLIHTIEECEKEIKRIQAEIVKLSH